MIHIRHCLGTILLLLLLTACASQRLNDVEPLGRTRPGAAEWSQFHADGPSHGSYWVASDWAITPIWSVEVGPVAHASPVIGADGTIYIGNLDGELNAVRSDGSVLWRRPVNAMSFQPASVINAAAAVAESGLIYVISTRLRNDKLRSTLSVFSAVGNQLNTTAFPDDGFSTSAPKLWQTRQGVRVVAYSRTEVGKSALLVFDQDGELLAQKAFSCPKDDDSFWDKLVDFFSDFIDLWADIFWTDGPGVDFDPSGPGPGTLYERFGWIDPSVAVVTSREIASHDNPLLVLADNNCLLRALKWDGGALSELWAKDHKGTPHSSPAVFQASGTLVVGREDGKVIGYNPLSGDTLWEFDAGEGVMATPASLGGLVYVVSLSTVHGLGPATGDLIWQVSLPAESIASPAMSGNFIYVSHVRGLQSLSLDLSDFVSLGTAPGGLSSPAIGKDGTLYAIKVSGGTAFLQAFPARD